MIRKFFCVYQIDVGHKNIAVDIIYCRNIAVIYLNSFADVNIFSQLLLKRFTRRLIFAMPVPNAANDEVSFLIVKFLFQPVNDV